MHIEVFSGELIWCLGFALKHSIEGEGGRREKKKGKRIDFLKTSDKLGNRYM